MKNHVRFQSSIRGDIFSLTWTTVPAVEAGDGQKNHGDQDGNQHSHQRPTSSIHDPAVDDRKWMRASEGDLQHCIIVDQNCSNPVL